MNVLQEYRVASAYKRAAFILTGGVILIICGFGWAQGWEKFQSGLLLFFVIPWEEFRHGRVYKGEEYFTWANPEKPFIPVILDLFPLSREDREYLRDICLEFWSPVPAKI